MQKRPFPKSIMLGAGIVALFLVVGIYQITHNNVAQLINTAPQSPVSAAVVPVANVAKPTPTQSTATTSTTPAPSTYSLTQVATHHTSSDCWTTISGGVYNVTSFIRQHPGGSSAIISLCGIDGSSAFIDQHSGQRRPANELATFKIGTLLN